MLACGTDNLYFNHYAHFNFFKSNQTAFLTTTLIGICNPLPDDTKKIGTKWKSFNRSSPRHNWVKTKNVFSYKNEPYSRKYKSIRSWEPVWSSKLGKNPIIWSFFLWKCFFFWIFLHTKMVYFTKMRNFLSSPLHHWTLKGHVMKFIVKEKEYFKDTPKVASFMV